MLVLQGGNEVDHVPIALAGLDSRYWLVALKLLLNPTKTLGFVILIVLVFRNGHHFAAVEVKVVLVLIGAILHGSA